jgi:hypothetical protein
LVVFTRLQDKMVMSIGGTYYQKVPFSKIIAKRIIVGTVLFLMLNGFALFLYSVVQFFRGKYAFYEALINSLPAVACLFLILAFLRLFEVMEFSYLLAELSLPGIRSITIFGCTIIFAVLNVGAAYFAFKRLRANMSFLNWYYAIITISLMIATLYLTLQGVIGLRSWAM